MAGCCKVEPLLPLPFAREPSLLAKRAYLNLSPRRLSSFTPWCPVVAPRANATNHALFLSSPGDGAGTSPPPPLGLVRPSRQVPTRSPQSNGFREWDAMTARFVGTANMSFLLLKLPQIIPNARNLMASNKGALFVVPWLLAMVECMPLPHFTVTSMVMGTGLVLNFLNCFGWLGEGAWRRWEDFITVGGLVVLPQAGDGYPSVLALSINRLI
ncbi:hypothetical protein Taro_001385 [Colocasia esculenta]|uniref:Uncharacterized protein n=1 Tax=Colocasia esculenta TaxID=4460 RepID=A0A843TJ07_COLES|nr:hypothetical protein [Colocasia esculenta]